MCLSCIELTTTADVLLVHPNVPSSGMRGHGVHVEGREEEGVSPPRSAVRRPQEHKLPRQQSWQGSIGVMRPVRLAYQPPASSTFLSEQTSHQ
jgi:hypothetical protein